MLQNITIETKEIELLVSQEAEDGTGQQTSERHQSSLCSDDDDENKKSLETVLNVSEIDDGTIGQQNSMRSRETEMVEVANPPSEIENGTWHDILERYQRSPKSSTETEEMFGSENHTTHENSGCFQRGVKKMKKIIHCIYKYCGILRSSDGTILNKRFLVLCMISLILEPILLYTPVLKDDKKCFKVGKALGIFAVVYRSIADLIYLLHFPWVILITLSIDEPFSIHMRWLPFLLDLPIILPLPQILVILALLQRISGRKFLLAMNFFIAQHVLRTLQLYQLFLRVMSRRNVATWSQAGFGLSFLHAGHVTGALWYFFAVQRKIECWKKACMNQIGCDNHSFYCKNNSGNYTFSDVFCSTNTENTNIYDFGLFREAIHSRLVEEANFFRRLMAGFRWGIQILSFFGQGLNTSTNALENIFALTITMTGLVLFFFLIGKVQMHVQSEAARSAEKKQMLRKLENYRPFRNLTPTLQETVRNVHSLESSQTVDVVYLVDLVDNISYDNIRNEVKLELCLDQLRKVEEFENYSLEFLKEQMKYIKPVVYTPQSCIVKENDPIDKMVFVLDGMLGIKSSSSAYPPKYLKSGEFWGQEVVDWVVLNDPLSSDLSSSPATVEAVTKVEALVLMAKDLLDIIREHRSSP